MHVYIDEGLLPGTTARADVGAVCALHLGDTAGRWRDAGQLELAQQVVVLRA